MTCTVREQLETGNAFAKTLNVQIRSSTKCQDLFLNQHCQWQTHFLPCALSTLGYLEKKGKSSYTSTVNDVQQNIFKVIFGRP